MTQTLNEALNFNSSSINMLIQEGLKKLSTDLRVGVPGIVQSFDPDTVTATIQPGVRESIKNYDTLVPQWTNLPLLVDVPVLFPGSSAYVMTFPLSEGDEVFVIFADMNIDGFWQTGQVSNQTRLRRHSLSDGFAIPVQGMSQPKVQNIVNFNSSAPELRTADGSVKLSFVEGGFKLTGNLDVTGTVTASNISG